MLQARLDRLDPAGRETVAVAAVIGRRFGMPLLERVLRPDTLPAALLELQRLDLIVEERRRPYPEYRFRHGLVQEAAYASLTESDRQALHRRVGVGAARSWPATRRAAARWRCWPATSAPPTTRPGPPST